VVVYYIYIFYDERVDGYIYLYLFTHKKNIYII
jgi:hypothetical protein